MTKLIFLGCLSNSRYKETCENSIKIIQYLDNQYKVFNDIPCCGSLLFQIANDEEIMAHVNIVNNWFNRNEITDIVTICAGCYNYLSKYYKKYIPDFSINIKHTLQFIAEEENLRKLNLKYVGKKIAINYHDPCHLKNAITPILDEPRKILSSIENIELKEMENSGSLSICCGAGGGVFSIFKENSDYNSLSIFRQMRRTKALITSCPFCYTALKRIRDDKTNKVRTPVIKFEDFIYKIMNGEDPLK
ncbi:MAG: (Fe-S)-binding protein [Promethearchaeota archaeon]